MQKSSKSDARFSRYAVTDGRTDRRTDKRDSIGLSAEAERPKIVKHKSKILLHLWLIKLFEFVVDKNGGILFSIIDSDHS